VWLAGQAPTQGIGSAIDLGPGLAHLPAVAAQSLDAVLVSPHHPWPGPEIAPWPQGLFPDLALRWLGWGFSGALIVFGALQLRRPGEAGRAGGVLALGAGLATLALPVGLGLIGFGPVTLDELGLPRLIKFDARRAVLLPPLQALGLAALLVPLLRMERARPVALGIAGLLVLLPLTRVVGTLAEGGSLGAPLALQRTGFIPEAQPKEWKEYVVEFRYPDQHVSLGAIGTDDRADDLPSLRAALLAYRSVDGGPDACGGDVDGALMDAEGMAEEPLGDDAVTFAWQSAGRAVEDKCGHFAGDGFCAGAPDDPSRDACLDGVRRSYEDPHPADFYEEPGEPDED